MTNFVVLDYFSNQNIERELGKMGVETRRSLTVGGFLRDAIIPKILKKGEFIDKKLTRGLRIAVTELKDAA